MVIARAGARVLLLVIEYVKLKANAGPTGLSWPSGHSRPLRALVHSEPSALSGRSRCVHTRLISDPPARCDLAAPPYPVRWVHTPPLALWRVTPPG